MKKIKYKRIKIIIILVITSHFFSLYLVHIIGKNINETIRSYSQIEAERFATFIINKSIDKKTLKQFNNDLIITTINKKGEIQMLDFKAQEANQLLEKVTKKVQNNLIKLENGKIKEFEIADSFKGLKFKKIKKGVVCEIPEGIIYNNALLGNIGPSIPIKLSFIGQVTSNIKTKVENYGINNVYLAIYIHIEVKERITMPLRTKDIVIAKDIPVAIKIIQGSIPNYYHNPILNDSSQFSLPIS